MSEDRLHAAVAAGAFAGDQRHRELLTSIVDAARAIFEARASSVMLLDDEAGELVFEAISGEGAEELVGHRFPAGEGIAGWVIMARQPLVIEDVSRDPRFAAGVAESTGYVPRGLMAVPLLLDEDAIGVLEVLDRPEGAAFSLEEMRLLVLFAHQAAIALELMQRARRASTELRATGDEAGVLARLAARLDGLEGTRKQALLDLLEALERTLA